MESFLVRYQELVKDAITAATDKITLQKVVRDAAAKKVQELRAIDRTSLYTSIGSNAGQAEISYNIEEARLRHEIEQRGFIYHWADVYLEYVKGREDSYHFNSFDTFSEFYTTVNKNHIEQLIRGHKFECKCQFFGHATENNQPSEDHFYINGDECCSFGVPVHLSNIKTVTKTIGLIGHQNPVKINIYPIPNNFVD